MMKKAITRGVAGGPAFVAGTTTSRTTRVRPSFARPLPLRFPMASASSVSSSMQSELPLLRSVLGAITKPYLEKNPTAVSAMNLIQTHDGGPLSFDHFAFRTFGIDGCGIDSIAQLFLDLGYETRDELRFPQKKLRALWFSPPNHSVENSTPSELSLSGPLPRIFISELLVDELSADAQAVISKYVQSATRFSKHAAIASVVSSLTWPTPSVHDYQVLARESEYAAWTLVNGYALNHLTISVHGLNSDLKKISELNKFLQANGIKLNSEGGILKVSPDGGLLQSSTVADSIMFQFTGHESMSVPASYIEFAERLVLQKYIDLPTSEIREWHRRDGFEVGNADKIFESTSSTQTGVK